MFNTTYAIQSACNIPSDSVEHKVSVHVEEVDTRSECMWRGGHKVRVHMKGVDTRSEYT